MRKRGPRNGRRQLSRMLVSRADVWDVRTSCIAEENASEFQVTGGGVLSHQLMCMTNEIQGLQRLRSNNVSLRMFCQIDDATVVAMNEIS